jgi:hypothetical protein
MELANQRCVDTFIFFASLILIMSLDQLKSGKMKGRLTTPMSKL